ncbi:MAG: phospholipase [Deltaproteobacteria bacterium]|nr:phospholipase [Deltaproteobacteria bacterium]
MSSGPPVEDASFLGALGAVGSAVLATLASMEQVSRRMHPQRIDALRGALVPLAKQLDEARVRLANEAAPEGLADLRDQLLRAAEHSAQSVALFVDTTPAPDAIARVLRGMHEHCRAQDALFPLRSIPPVNRYFLEPQLHERLEDFAGEPSADPEAGLFSASNSGDQRGGFSLYVPERGDADRPRALVVALHGGMGHGADFIWTWMREARSRGFLLLAPTSRETTWSFNGPDVDGPAIRAMVASVKERWNIDAERVLLTGLSDGATFALLSGLGEDSPFTALAPLSGVLHPANLSNGNLERAEGRRIYLVHGALDWMFPVQVAREAARLLREAGAELVYREIENLSHAYAREENAAILEWFDPALALDQE